MKIAYVSTRSDTIGGSNVHIRDVGCEMQRLGHEVHILGGGNGPFGDDVRRHGLRYHPLRYLGRDVRPLHDLAACFELRTRLTAIRPQIISLHTAKAGFVGRFSAVGLRTPVVYTPHGWPFTPGVPAGAAAVYAALERIAAPLADRIVNVCDFERDIAIARRIADPDRHVVVHNGMPDVPPTLRADPSRRPPGLIMVARFEEQKDHETLFGALCSCMDLPWTLQLVGGGPLMEASRRLAADLGLDARVTFEGPRTDVDQLLSQAQVFVLASRWEGFPRSILEAMRAGLPVVASAVGGVHEAVADGASGYVVPARTDAPLAERLRTLLSDPALRVRLGDEGRRRYEASFTFATMFQKTLDVYHQLGMRA